jgi:MFS family permease
MFVVQNEGKSARRSPSLALLCFSVCVIVMDGTIVNVALPTLLRELNGGTTIRQLQWIVDAYILVFAGLLIAAGSLGDRFCRRRTLLIGLVLFAIFSGIAGLSREASTLIFWRAMMGIGAALIFPATLAIIVNLFPGPRERDGAVGAWAAMSGLGVAIGPATGGFILEHTIWGWVFFINVPLCLLIAVGVIVWVPPSRDPTARKLMCWGRCFR